MKNQTDQSASLYSVMFWYSLHVIGQFGFLFFCNGTSNLNQLYPVRAICDEGWPLVEIQSFVANTS